MLKDLPSRTEINLTVELSKQEATLYERLRLDALDALQSDIDDVGDVIDNGSSGAGQPRRFAILAQLIRLRRLCCNPKLIEPQWTGPQSKLDLFNNTLEELLANRHKVLVFSQFVDHLRLIETVLIKN